MATQLLPLPFEATGSACDQYVWSPSHPFRMPASLLTRLGEAVKGIRTGELIYFVAQLKRDPKKGHDVIGYFLSAQEACDKEAARLISGEYLIFGPYLTVKDPDYKPNKLVKKVVLYLQPAAGGPLEPVCLDGAAYDCVFWGLSAVDKFVVPYYSNTGSPEEAQAARDAFKDPAAYALIHIPGSEYTTTISSTSCVNLVTIPEALNRVGPYLLLPGPAEEGPPDFIPV